MIEYKYSNFFRMKVLVLSTKSHVVDWIDSFLLDAIENSIMIHGMVWEEIFWSNDDQIFSLRFHQMTCDPLP